MPPNMLKVCIWLNFPSIHQTPLIRALEERSGIDLQVRYYDRSTAVQDRRAQGWEVPDLHPCERFIGDGNCVEEVSDFGQRVHIIPGISHPFCRRLVDTCVRNGVEWCHWGERTGIRFSTLIHGSPRLLRLVLPSLNRIVRRGYARKINQASLGVFAIGRLAEADFVSWGVRRELIRHLYYSTADVAQVIRPAAGGVADPECGIRFIYVGSIYREKGIGTLLHALGRLKTWPWHLTMVGKDLSQGQYQKLARKIGIGDRVDWVGPVKSSDVGRWLGAADVLLLPSFFDGWGAVLNEGACAGKALVATTQSGAAWHVIEPGVNGFRVPPGSAVALTEAMLAYLEDPGLARRHGEASRNLYLQEFTAQRNADRLEAAIRDWRSRSTGWSQSISGRLPLNG